MLHLYLFIYLFLAHLLADFVFQPEALVAWKHKSWKGIFVHSLVLFVTGLVFFWPFVATVNLAGVGVLFGNAVLHFAMDAEKIRKERRGHGYVRLFFLDQSFHIAVLGVLTFVMAYFLQTDLFSMGHLLAFFSGFFPFALYLIVAVLSTYVYEIVKFQFLRNKHQGHSLKFHYKDMFFRLMVLSLVFGLVLFLAGFNIARTFLG